MSVAVIGGTGSEGFGLAVRWAAAGRPILIGSRALHKARQALAALREIYPSASAQALENADAAARAEIVVLTIPYASHAAVLPALAPMVRGKVVIDTTVPFAGFDPVRLETPAAGSAAQQVQELLGRARVAAAFHTVSAVALREFDRALEGDVLVCGDDDRAKETALELARDIGMRAFDAGPLAHAAWLEQLCALLVDLNIRHRRRHLGIRLVGI